MSEDALLDELDHYRASVELASELPMTADPRRVVTLHAPRLLAALDGVLKLHVQAPEPDTAFCADCGLGYPCPTVQAISRGLLDSGAAPDA